MSVSNLLHSVAHLHPEHGTVDTQTIARQLSGTITFDVEMRAFDEDPWTIKVPRFDTAEDAYGYIDDLVSKPVYKDCYKGCSWRVVETHRIAVTDERGLTSIDAAQPNRTAR